MQFPDVDDYGLNKGYNFGTGGLNLAGGGLANNGFYGSGYGGRTRLPAFGLSGLGALVSPQMIDPFYAQNHRQMLSMAKNAFTMPNFELGGEANKNNAIDLNVLRATSGANNSNLNNNTNNNQKKNKKKTNNNSKNKGSRKEKKKSLREKERKLDLHEKDVVTYMDGKQSSHWWMVRRHANGTRFEWTGLLFFRYFIMTKNI